MKTIYEYDIDDLTTLISADLHQRIGVKVIKGDLDFYAEEGSPVIAVTVYDEMEGDGEDDDEDYAGEDDEHREESFNDILERIIKVGKVKERLPKKSPL